MDTKAFKNHKANGVLLHFPNGNSVSTIWSTGSYTENHDHEIRNSEGELDFDRMFYAKNGGSDTVEVMINCGPELSRALDEKFNGGGSGVIGWLSITDWLEVINRVANEVK